MASLADDLDSLDAELSRLSTTDAKLDAVSRWAQAGRIADAPSVFLSSEGTTRGADQLRSSCSESESDQFFELLAKHGVSAEAHQKHMLEGKMGRGEHILNKLPCAHVIPGQGWRCPQDGTLTCSSCKIVRYCSKDCQSKHWKKHKSDCKDDIRSDQWTPVWIRERRQPAFVEPENAPEPSDWRSNSDRMAMGIALWGNMTAISVLNKPTNAKTARGQDLDLAFVASGDLRNMLLSVNALPIDYSGKLSITLNDHNYPIVLRNILLLSLLGTGDSAKAADVALHVWYSAFIPMEYHLQATSHAADILTSRQPNGCFAKKLGPRALMKGSLSQDEFAYMASTVTSRYTASDVNSEMHRVRFAHHRRDYWDKYLSSLEPTHRLAVLEYRRFGLVHPFGAANFHFNAPNRFLFTPKGHWLQRDHAIPLECWDIDEVLEAGKQHGATRGDLFGCLYFYLQDQLRAFAERLSRFDISFHIFCADACRLAKDIRSGTLSEAIPPSISFDRVEVSNTFDSEYIGAAKLLVDWAPLLKRVDDAAIVGSFMNWAPKQRGAMSSSCDQTTLARITKAMAKDGRVPVPPSASGRPVSEMREMMIMTQLFSYMSNQTAYLDNSGAFNDYLRKAGMDEALKKHGLELRRTHKIVPHRICAPLNAEPSALPKFVDNEAWYLHAKLGSWTWTERFVEIVRKK